MRGHFFRIAAALWSLWICPPTDAGLVVYDITQNGGLAGFNSAAGNPPVTIDFDNMAANTDISGVTVSGVTFNPSTGGAPLIVVNGNDTYTPGPFFDPGSVIDAATNKLFPTSGNNVLSPGGLELAPGPNTPVENDDLELVFQQPVSAFGFDHLSQSADGFSFTSIQVFNQFDVLIPGGTVMVPISPTNAIVGGAPAGADFWGVTTTGGDLIGRIVISEDDADSKFPDSNIGFDTFRFTPPPQIVGTPEPSTLAIFGLGSMLFAGARVRRKRRHSGR